MNVANIVNPPSRRYDHTDDDRRLKFNLRSLNASRCSLLTAGMQEIGYQMFWYSVFKQEILENKIWLMNSPRCIPKYSTLACVDTIQLEQCRFSLLTVPTPVSNWTLDKPIVRLALIAKTIWLSDNTVSRFHCEIDMYGMNTSVDRQSTNGCYFGDLRLVEGYLYQTEILVGKSFDLNRLLSAIPVKKLGWRFDRVSACDEKIYGLLDKVAPSELSVVVQGETGTGKELVARAIHNLRRERTTRHL